MKLKSSIDYGKSVITEPAIEYRRKRERYDGILIQNLSEPYEINGVTAHPLNRFVSCDLAGNVLEEPKEADAGNYLQYCELQQEYQQAVERVVFKGLEFKSIEFIGDMLKIDWTDTDVSCLHDCTIESMVEYDAELTESYTKYLGL